jgi:hypothetical protein
LEGPALGVNARAEEGKSLWCDAFLRVPDYIAGTVSGWNIEENTVPSAKYLQVLANGIAGNRYFHLMRVLISHEKDLISAAAQSIGVLKKTSNLPQATILANLSSCCRAAAKS